MLLTELFRGPKRVRHIECSSLSPRKIPSVIAIKILSVSSDAT